MPFDEVFTARSRFYRAALNAGRSSEEKAVRLSVRLLSVKRMYCGKMEKKSVQIFIP